MEKQVVHLPNGLALFASDIFLALSKRGVVAVVVHSGEAEPLTATEGDGILFVATVPKTADDLNIVRTTGARVGHLSDGPSRTAEEIVQTISEGAMIVVLHKKGGRDLAIDDILFLAVPINLPILTMLRMAEEANAQAETHMGRLADRLLEYVVHAWSPSSEEPSPPWLT